MFNENYMTPTQIIKKENEERTFGMDEIMKYSEKTTNFLEILNIANPIEAQKEFVEWCSRYSDTELARLFKTKSIWIKKIRNILKIEKNRTGTVSIKDIPKDWPPSESFKKYVEDYMNGGSNVKISYSKLEERKPKISIEKQEEQTTEMGMNITIRGIYDTKKLSKKLENLSLWLSEEHKDNEENENFQSKFYLELVLKQV